MGRSFWINLFTNNAWEEFLDSENSVTGFSKRKWRSVQMLSQGDVLLCFNKDKSGFCGALEVVGAPYMDNTPLFKDDFLPCRVQVKLMVQTSIDQIISPVSLQDRLSIFHNMENPNMWTDYFRNSPAEFTSHDGEVVLKAMLSAGERSDVSNDSSSFKTFKTNVGVIAIPPSGINYSLPPSVPMIKTAYLLLQLGEKRGHKIWSNSRYRGRPIEDGEIPKFPSMLATIPDSMEEAAAALATDVCVIWFDQSGAVAAFVIESSGDLLYSVVLLSDLALVNPGIKCYLVCPGDLEEEATRQLNRPSIVGANNINKTLIRMLTFSSVRSVFEDGRVHEKDVLEKVSKIFSTLLLK
jgi:hypothetical protein